MDIGGVGDDYSHSQGHRIETLAKGESEGPSGEFGEIRLDQILDPFARSRHIQGINHDEDD